MFDGSFNLLTASVVCDTISRRFGQIACAKLTIVLYGIGIFITSV